MCGVFPANKFNAGDWKEYSGRKVEGDRMRIIAGRNRTKGEWSNMREF